MGSQVLCFAVESWNGLGEKGQGHLPLDQGAPSPV